MIEFLTPKLFDGAHFDFYKSWKRILGFEPGWHYPLDILWILNSLTEAVPPPATIMDIGAGSGPLQFLLAALGYDVISVDLVTRSPGRVHRTFFNFVDDQREEIESEYTEHLRSRKSGRSSSPASLSESFRMIGRRLATAARLLHPQSFSAYRSRSGYGVIKLVVADFTTMQDYRDADAFVSVSALEHIPTLKGFSYAVEKLRGSGLPFFASTSGSRDATWWHEPSKGWCFGPDLLSDELSFSTGERGNWKELYDHAFEEVFNSTYLRKNIPSYYFGNPHCGLPFGEWSPKYLPIGLTDGSS